MSQFDLLADPGTTVAVVGATDSPGKYGGIIYRDLRDRGYAVVAVNPNRSVVAGDAAFPDLASLPEQPDIVNVVVPPSVGEEIVDQVVDLGWPSIWFQPGADGSRVVAKAHDAGLDVVAGDCVMVVARLAPR